MIFSGKIVTLQLALTFLLFLLCAVIVTLPAVFADTFPLEFTVAILLLEEYHLTDVLEDLGVTFFTFNWKVLPVFVR